MPCPERSELSLTLDAIDVVIFVGDALLHSFYTSCILIINITPLRNERVSIATLTVEISTY